MMKTYDLSSEGHDLLLEAFPSCPVCGSADDMQIDHDHKTGAVRGRLCRKHNVGLGFFQDDPERLQKAIDYLMSFEDFRKGKE